MTDSSAAYYQEQYDEVQAQQNQLEAQYEQSWASIDSQSSSISLITLMTSTLPIIMEYIESQEMNSAVTMDALTTMQTDENGIQSDFDDVNSMTSDYEAGLYASYDDYNADVMDKVDDASTLALNMEGIAALPEFSSIGDDVDTQLNSILDLTFDENGVTSGYSLASTAADWEDAWGVSSDGTIDDDATATATEQQTYANSFSALSTDFSNLSASTQSELQYEEGEDQEMQSLLQSLLQTNVSQLTTMVNNQITS